jgi:hypothetical protein
LEVRLAGLVARRRLANVTRSPEAPRSADGGSEGERRDRTDPSNAHHPATDLFLAHDVENLLSPACASWPAAMAR